MLILIGGVMKYSVEFGVLWYDNCDRLCDVIYIQ